MGGCGVDHVSDARSSLVIDGEGSERDETHTCSSQKCLCCGDTLCGLTAKDDDPVLGGIITDGGVFESLWLRALNGGREVDPLERWDLRIGRDRVCGCAKDKRGDDE